MSAGQFEHLLRPIEFAGLKLKNRMVMAPMATNLATGAPYKKPPEK